MLNSHASRIRNFLLGGGATVALLAGTLTLDPTAANAATPKIPTPAAAANSCKAVGGAGTKLRLYGAGEGYKGKVTTAVIRPGKNYVPVLFVHGWNTSSGKDNTTFIEPVDKTSPDTKANMVAHDRSLVGMVQSISNTAAYSYDYSKKSERWVSSTFQGLSAAITCLSKQTHQKIIVVAHSMGGLNTRVALARSAAVRKSVSKVITFGTPVLGSKIARQVWAVVSGKSDDAARDLVLDPTSTSTLLQQLLTVFLFNCSQGGDAGNQKACADNLITNFEGDAGRALRNKSEQMKAVSSLKWPKSVHTLALYGDMDLGNVNFGIPDIFWNTKLDGLSTAMFGAAKLHEPDRAQYLDLKHPGDLVVDPESAEYDAWKTVKVRCALFDGSDTDAIHSTTGMNPMNSTCYHGNLMRSTKLAAAAVKAVKAQVSAQIKQTIKVTQPKPVKVPVVPVVPTPVTPAAWTLNGQGLGPISLWQHSEDVAAAAGTSYSGFVDRIVANQSSRDFCLSYYTPLKQDRNTGLMVGFDSTYDNRNSLMNWDDRNQSVSSILVRKTGVASVDAKLPKTDKGIGIGSTEQQVFNAYGDGAAPEKSWISYNKLIETTDERHQQDMTEIGPGDRTFTIDGAEIKDAPFGFGGYLSFKTHNGLVIGMSAKSGLGLGYYSDPEFECGNQPMMQ